MASEAPWRNRDHQDGRSWRASGYTGADLIRLAAQTSHIEITALIAKVMRASRLGRCFRILRALICRTSLPLTRWIGATIDLVFCGLPHGTAHEEIAKLPSGSKLSTCRLTSASTISILYDEWYGGEHRAPELPRKQSMD